MAPSLEKIHFSRTAIQLMDIKSLHAVLSKLKEITLDHIYLYEEEEDRIEDDNLSQHPPAAEGVVSISLSGISPVVNRQIMFAASQVDERFSNTLCRWISYIGSIYKHLQELALLSRSFSKIDKSLVSTSLADALVNLKILQVIQSMCASFQTQHLESWIETTLN
jgi:hypothetical protein